MLVGFEIRKVRTDLEASVKNQQGSRWTSRFLQTDAELKTKDK